MDRVARHLRLAKRLVISNVWLFEHEGRRFLVDTGHPVERIALLLDLWKAGVRKKGDLTAILLTHRHSDHAGNAAFLRKRFACPVVCHEDDAPLLTGKAKPSRLGGRGARFFEEALCWFEDRWPARCEVDETYKTGAWRWDFEVTNVPGHTEGSVVLYHGATKTLFSGDTILAGPPPLRSIEYLRLAVPGFSIDAPTCHANVKRFLAKLPPTRTLCSGHGPAVKTATHEKLLRLLER